MDLTKAEQHNDKVDNRRSLLLIACLNQRGGMEAALFSMLSRLDTAKYDITILFTDISDYRRNEVPGYVHVLEMSERDKMLVKDAKYSIEQIKKGRHIFTGLLRCYYSLLRKAQRLFGSDRDSWVDVRKHVKPVPGTYDIAVDYVGFYGGYLADKVNAMKKVTWNHFDYSRISYNKISDEKYFGLMDAIVSVSDGGADVLKEYFPEISDKVMVIENFIDEDGIIEKAGRDEDVTEDIFGRKDRLYICSVGRLEDQKNFELSVMAAKELKAVDPAFTWLIIGKGSQREMLEKLIEENDLRENVLLLGEKTNPYVYMKKSDIYVQTSRFEGKCIAVVEALILGRPCIVTDTPILRDNVIPGVTGTVAEQSPAAVCKAILEMDEQRRREYSENLRKVSVTSNDESFKRLEVLFG